MGLDLDSCNRARLSRDLRFDGRFFVAVVTTGIYCRPICPAPPARRTNIRFYPCAAAAEEEGFRPCRRCRPETSPGTPAWLGTSATVSRALRLISDGWLDHGSVEALALHLGIGDRHLRRLFLQHLGASPKAVAQSRRVHFAKRLIDETMLPFSQVALGSGFGSVRQFNTTVRHTFGRAPKELRRAAGAFRSNPDAGLTLRLSFRPPLDWRSILQFLELRATAGVESVRANCYRRSIQLNGSSGIIEVGAVKNTNSLQLRILASDTGDLFQVVERVRRIFDLAADPLEISSHLERDPALARFVHLHSGLRIPGTWDGFELGVRAVLGQQVSVAAATTLAGRLVRKCGEPLDETPYPEVSRLFPPPATLAKADLSGLGITRARARTIRDLARAVCRGDVSFDSPKGLDFAVSQLKTVAGIGDWTAHYIAMRAMREPDAFPSSDLGLVRALSVPRKTLSPAEVEQRAEAWRPWRAYAAMHFWMHGSPNAAT